MRLTVDRFEGDFAVCEKPDRSIIKIARSELPEGAKEGDVLTVDDRSIAIDIPGTMRRQRRIKGLMRGLWKNTGDHQ